MKKKGMSCKTVVKYDDNLEKNLGWYDSQTVVVLQHARPLDNKYGEALQFSLHLPDSVKDNAKNINKLDNGDSIVICARLIACINMAMATMIKNRFSTKNKKISNEVALLMTDRIVRSEARSINATSKLHS